MDRQRKRKDVTPKESEKRKQANTDQSDASATSMLSQITSKIAAMTSSRSRAPSVSSSSEASSATSYRSSNNPRTNPITMGRATMTDLDEGGTKFGKFRDVIEVDVLFIDGNDYTTNMTIKDAHKYVCKRGLGIKRSRIHAVRTEWRGHPLIIIRLKEKINIDNLPPNFEYETETTNEDGSLTKHKVVCDVRGVGMIPANENRRPPRPEESPLGPWIRWVKIEGTGFEINRDKLKELLSKFGTIETPFETETVSFTDDEEESDDEETTDRKVTLSTGKLSVRMIIDEPIPQFVPCEGKKLKIHYRGIQKLCTKCYGPGHMRKDCSENEVHWLEYFGLFRETYPTIDKAHYGRWNRLYDMWIKSKPTNA